MPPRLILPVEPSGNGQANTQLTELKRRVSRLSLLFEKLAPVPETWVLGGSEGDTRLESLPCHSYEELATYWHKAMHWIDGLDLTMVCMLASAGSVRINGEPLWLQVLSIPSSGKSSICEAMNVASRYVKSLSVIRGFHSGARGKDGEDVSVMAQIRNKCFITKDGDTILKLVNRDQVLAEARDLYDRCSRTHYRSGLKRDYENWHTHWILCGTSSLRDLDSSELGERFLRVRIMEEIDTDLEMLIGMHKLDQMESLYATNPGITDKGADTPYMIEAKQRTGGYICYLRENMEEMIRNIRITREDKLFIYACGTFVSYMRARQSKKQSEETQRELSVRLVSQFGKLAYSMSAVMNKSSLDEEIKGRLQQIALDTANGKTFEIARVLFEAGDDGLESPTIYSEISRDEDEMKGYLSFLRKIEAVTCYRVEYGPNMYSTWRWRLHPTVKNLYRQVALPLRPLGHQEPESEAEPETVEQDESIAAYEPDGTENLYEPDWESTP